MATNLLEMISSAVTPAHVQGLSRHLGENESAVRGGISALLPVVLGGMASKAASPAGATSLFSMLNAPDLDGDAPGHFGRALETGPSGAMLQGGSSMLSGLFGSDKATGLTSALAGMTGMRISSASSLASMLMPLVFGLMKRFVGSSRMDAGGLASLLAGQGRYLEGRLDPRLTAAAGLGSPDHLLGRFGGATATAGAATAGTAAAAATMDRSTADTAHAYRTHEAAAVDRSSGMRRWLPWVLAAAIAALLLGQLASRRDARRVPDPATATAPSVTTTAPPTASVEPSTTAPADSTVASAGPTTAPADTATAPAATANAPADTAAVPPLAATSPSPDMSSPGTTTAASTPPGTDTTTSSTATMGAAAATQLPARVFFETGKAVLNPDGRVQVRTVAGMLASNPDLRVDVTGYTDQRGSTASNERLAQERATAVRDALQGEGVATTRIVIKPAMAVEDASAGDDAQARRVEILAAQ